MCLRACLRCTTRKIIAKEIKKGNGWSGSEVQEEKNGRGFELSLSSIASSMPAWATQKDIVSGKNKMM